MLINKFVGFGNFFNNMWDFAPDHTIIASLTHLFDLVCMISVDHLAFFVNRKIFLKIGIFVDKNLYYCMTNFPPNPSSQFTFQHKQTWDTTHTIISSCAWACMYFCLCPHQQGQNPGSTPDTSAWRSLEWSPPSTASRPTSGYRNCLQRAVWTWHWTNREHYQMRLFMNYLLKWDFNIILLATRSELR